MPIIYPRPSARLQSCNTSSNIVAREPISSIEGLRRSFSAFGGRGMIDDFQHVSVTCQDLERSIHFYERFGLKVIQGFVGHR
jgi:hypothetical protein